MVRKFSYAWMSAATMLSNEKLKNLTELDIIKCVEKLDGIRYNKKEGGVCKMNKIKTIFITLAMIVTVALGMGSPKVKAADAVNFEQVPITVLEDMTDFDTSVNLSWQIDYALDRNAGVGEQTYYAKFTLPQDSIVRIKSNTEKEKAFSNNKEFTLYGNSSMGKALVTNDIGYGSGDDWLNLKAGVYYMKCRSELYMSGTSNHTIKVSIGAVPLSKAVTFTQTPNGNKTSVIVDVKQHFAEASVIRYEYAEGNVTASSSWNGTGLKSPQFTVTKNGWYTVRIYVRSTVAWNQDMYYYVPINVKGIDTTAPKISGVSPNKYYKKAVTVKFSDTGSGIKSALLNGKSIKSGKKVKTDARYTLKVTDKAGNSKTVKFVVDKKAPTTNIKAKTYYASVKITFKDKTAGIKAATLNGKKIKSGKKVTANGSYTLKLTDKAGNKKVIKFKIEK